MKYAEKKTSLKWGKNRDPGYEYPSDVRLDDFEHNNGEEGNMQDNVNEAKKRESMDSSNDIDDDGEPVESTQPTTKSWWSYLLPYNYLH